jgi:cytidine deaminase
MSQKSEPRVLIPYKQLSTDEQKLVDLAWKMTRRAHCPYSHFPVGAAILAQSSSGTTRVFGGCNVENASYGGTICAERTAAVKAVSEGFTKFLTVAVVCAKVPGGSPCGFCRQVLREFGKNATVLNISDRESSVVRWTVDDLLPDSFGPESL